MAVQCGVCENKISAFAWRLKQVDGVICEMCIKRLGIDTSAMTKIQKAAICNMTGAEARQYIEDGVVMLKNGDFVSPDEIDFKVDYRITLNWNEHKVWLICPLKNSYTDDDFTELSFDNFDSYEVTKNGETVLTGGFEESLWGTAIGPDGSLPDKITVQISTVVKDMNLKIHTKNFPEPVLDVVYINKNIRAETPTFKNHNRELIDLIEVLEMIFEYQANEALAADPELATRVAAKRAELEAEKAAKKEAMLAAKAAADAEAEEQAADDEVEDAVEDVEDEECNWDDNDDAESKDGE